LKKESPKVAHIDYVGLVGLADAQAVLLYKFSLGDHSYMDTGIHLSHFET
jgi:hypothetical protein